MSIVINALVAACKDKSCAPPPVGTGGSKPSGGGKPAGAGEAASGAEAFAVSQRSLPMRIGEGEGWDDRMNTVGTPFGAFVRYIHSGYRKINKALRNSVDDRDVELMDKAFDEYSVRLTAPIRVYRSMNFTELQRSEFMSSIRPGMIVKDKAFLSTSFDEDGMRRFMDVMSGSGKIRTVIDVPKGERVLAGRSKENELILDRGRRMEVLGVDPPDKDGIPTVRLRVLQ